MRPRHFLTLLDLSGQEFKDIIDRACELKAMLAQGAPHELLRNRGTGDGFRKVVYPYPGII